MLQVKIWDKLCQISEKCSKNQKVYKKDPTLLLFKNIYFFKNKPN